MHKFSETQLMEGNDLDLGLQKGSTSRLAATAALVRDQIEKSRERVSRTKSPLQRERKRRNLNRSRALLDLAEGMVVAAMEARDGPASLDLTATHWDAGGR